MNDRRVYQQVVVDELRGASAVCEDAAHSSGDEVHLVRTIRSEPVVDRGLVSQIELRARSGEGCNAVLLETPDDSRPDEAAVARDEHL